MSVSIVTERPVRGARQRKDDLLLHLKGLVHVRALLEVRGATVAELEAHSAAIARVRDELAPGVTVDEIEDKTGAAFEVGLVT